MTTPTTTTSTTATTTTITTAAKTTATTMTHTSNLAIWECPFERPHSCADSALQTSDTCGGKQKEDIQTQQQDTAQERRPEEDPRVG